MENIGNLDLVPAHRRAAGPGASYLMAPFTQVSKDRPSRFSDGTYGVLYVGREFETALFETMYHHARFMADTGQAAGWTSQFRELMMDVTAKVHDCRGLPSGDPVLSPDDYTAGQALASRLRRSGRTGLCTKRPESGRRVRRTVLSRSCLVPDPSPAPGLSLERRSSGFLQGCEVLTKYLRFAEGDVADS